MFSFEWRSDPLTVQCAQQERENVGEARGLEEDHDSFKKRHFTGGGGKTIEQREWGGGERT